MTNTDKENILKPASGRLLTGEVVSCDMQKTVVVKVDRLFKHPLLGKTITRSKNFKTHDENSEAKVGDIVEIVECKPVSKTKHMTLNCILKRAV